MLFKKPWVILVWLLAISLIILDAVILVGISNSNKEVDRFDQAHSLVNPSVALPAATLVAQSYDYCTLKQDAGLATDLQAGTPVPMQPVALGPTPTAAPTEMAQPTETSRPEANEPVLVPTLVPTLAPTATQPVYNELESWKPEVVDPGALKKSNFHAVVVGVGYPESENETKLLAIISGLENNFTGVNIDFAFVRNPVNLNLDHTEQAVNFSSNSDIDKILAKIRKVHPVDGIVLALDTPEFLGTSDTRQWAMLTGTDPNAVLIGSHEIGHLLGLGDGYESYYPNGYLPNSELFYSGSMPKILSDSLPKLKTLPPLYEVGTCNGNNVYTFYERSNNIMSDYNPQGPNPWGPSVFTPLQILEMNDFISITKEGN